MQWSDSHQKQSAVRPSFCLTPWSNECGLLLYQCRVSSRAYRWHASRILAAVHVRALRLDGSKQHVWTWRLDGSRPHVWARKLDVSKLRVWAWRLDGFKPSRM